MPQVLWAKGYTELLDRMKEHHARTGADVPVDVYGSGPDLPAVEQEAGKRSLALKFNGAKDHADSTIQDYKVRLLSRECSFGTAGGYVEEACDVFNAQGRSNHPEQQGSSGV